MGDVESVTILLHLGMNSSCHTFDWVSSPGVPKFQIRPSVSCHETRSSITPHHTTNSHVQTIDRSISITSICMIKGPVPGEKVCTCV